METIKKKITKATFKKFVQDNKNELFLTVGSHFDGMTDCVENIKDIPHKVKVPAVYTNDYTLGIPGVWLVHGSRNWFKHYEDELFVGISVSNCCGSFTVATIK